MKDPRVERLAKILVNYCVEVQPGDRVLLNGSIPAMPLVSETYRQILRAGGHPLILMQDDVFSEIFFQESSDEQLKYAEPHGKRLFVVPFYEDVTRIPFS